MPDHSRSASPTRPIHFYVDDAPYFITASTYQHRRLLTDAIKVGLRDSLHHTFADYGWTFDHWVILDDHYHLLGRSRSGRDLPRILNKVHHQTAQRINQRLTPERREGGPIWYNYWDYCPRTEREYNLRLCYLLNNPVKHGYVTNLHDWPWSSFESLFGERQDEGMRQLFLDHREYRTLSLPEDQ